MVRLIEAGYMDVLFAGNALATHDIEGALYGTSLGVNLAEGIGVEHGHEHHIRALESSVASCPTSNLSMTQSPPYSRMSSSTRDKIPVSMR